MPATTGPLARDLTRIFSIFRGHRAASFQYRTTTAKHDCEGAAFRTVCH
jgi:hypothetical protein